MTDPAPVFKKKVKNAGIENKRSLFLKKFKEYLLCHIVWNPDCGKPFMPGMKAESHHRKFKRTILYEDQYKKITD